ncbi:MAG: hydrogenase iron-sulfur subunit [Pseudomonadota bacterium]
MDNRPLKIYLFFCSNSFDTDTARRYCAAQKGEELKAISLPCSGKVDLLYLIKAFETGADGVMVITCKQDACRYLEGNLRAARRVEAVDSLLEEIGLGRGRIKLIKPQEEGDVEQIIREVDNFRATISSLTRSNSQ